MIIYRSKKKIVSVILLFMLFSPFVRVLAEEGTPIQTAAPATTETVASPQPVRGVDETNVGRVVTESAPVITPVVTTESTVPSTPTETLTSPSASDTTSEAPVSNNETGTNSENTAVSDTQESSLVDIRNEADVVNDIRGIIGTGGNVVMGKRGNVEVTTGDATAALNLINMINTIFAGLNSGNIAFLYKNVNGDLNQNYLIDPLTGEVTGLDGIIVNNSNTGRNSENTASSDSSQSDSVSTKNIGDLLNKINIEANTGRNLIDNVVGDNLINTGDADVSVNLLNFLNSTFVVGDFGVVGILNILGDWTGDLLLPTYIFNGASSPNLSVTNTNTGDSSENIASADTSNTDSIFANNNGNITNQIGINGTTGGNNIDSNVGDSAIVTGSINFLLSTKNFANLTVVGDVVYLAFVNVLGDWVGEDLIAKIFGFNPVSSPQANINNSETGQNSLNEASLDSENNNSINASNEGSITNLIDILANTGDNSIISERGDSTIQTGDINVLANVLNFINTNIYGKRIVLLFVNVFGDWNGNIDFLKPEEPKQVVVLENSKNNENITLTTAENSGQTNTSVVKAVDIKPQASVEQINEVNTDKKVMPAENLTKQPDSLTYGTTSSEDSLVELIMNNLNTLVFLLIVIYLTSVAIYIKATKKINI